MDSIGIICEYNPFHNGHIYHINKIKEMYPDSIIIAVVSGCFTQRGIPSLMTKKEKAYISIKNGVDLVVELPFIFSVQSADIFAEAAVFILNKLQVNKIIFGSECNNIELLKKLAETQLNDNQYNNIVKKYLDKGINYPSAMSMALEDLNCETITTPNDLLALSYIKAIIKNKFFIEPISIKRTNDFHSKKLNSKIVSASAIREALLSNKSIKKFVPKEVNDIIKKRKIDYFRLLKYKITLEKKDIKKYLTVDEGIENRIIKVINESISIEDLISKIKTKRYTYNKLSRMFIHILCSTQKDYIKDNNGIKYIRILGFNEKGQKYLNRIKKNIDIPIITNVKYHKELLEYELKIEEIFNIILNK